MRPPESAQPADDSKAAAVSSRTTSANNIKLVSLVARRLGKFLTAIKFRTRRQHPSRGPSPLMPHKSSTQPAIINFAAPSYCRFSERLTAARSSNTISGSSVLRGGSDSELPMLRHVSRLPGSDSPNGNRSPLLSPSHLGGFSLGTIQINQQQQLPQRGLSDGPTTPGRSRSRTSSDKALLSGGGSATAAAAAAAVVAAATSCPPCDDGGDQAFSTREQQRVIMYATSPASPNAGGATSFFSCWTGHQQMECDRTEPFSPAAPVALLLASPPRPSPPPHFLHASTLPQVDEKAAAAASMAMPLTACTGSPPAPSAGQWCNWLSAVPSFARCSGSDSLIQVGRIQASSTMRPRLLPPQQPLQPHIAASIPQSEGLESATCTIRSPTNTTLPSGSPLWPSDTTTRQLKAIEIYDRPSTARKLAYQAPELAAAMRAGGCGGDGSVATAAGGGGGGGAECEGRVRAGMQAAALLAGGTFSGRGSVGWPVPVQRVGSLPAPVVQARENGVTGDRMLAAAATATAADGAAAAALPAAVLKSKFLLRSAPESMLEIPFNSANANFDGGVACAGIDGGSARTVVGPSSTTTSTCSAYNSSLHSHGATSSYAPGAGPTVAAAVAVSCSSKAESCYSGVSASPPNAAVGVPGGGCDAADAASAAFDDDGGSQTSPPPPPPLPHTERSCQLLALNQQMPGAMRRSSWSLDDYSVTRRLYKGSTSAVYKAVCKRSGLPVALKVYFLNRVPAAVLHMICREIEIHHSVAHPNIIMLYAAFMTDKHLTLVMEYASRGDLYGIHHACNNRRMDEQLVAEMVLVPLLDAMSYLHSHGYCHRDIKPENVLFTSDWQLKLADFGVSIDLSKERAVTRAGTAGYMAPEVARCPLKVRPDDNKHDDALAYGTACDIWALGVLTYELLVGFTPLKAPAIQPSYTAAAATAAAATSTMRPALIFPSCLSKSSKDFVARALAARPQERPSAHSMRRHSWLTSARQVAAAAAAAAAAPATAPAAAAKTLPRVLVPEAPCVVDPETPQAKSPAILFGADRSCEWGDAA